MVSVWLSANALIALIKRRDKSQRGCCIRRTRLVLEWAIVSALYEVNSAWPSLRG